MHERTHRIDVKEKKKAERRWVMLQFSSVCVFFCCFFVSGDVEDAGDSTESHTPLLRASSVQPDLRLLAEPPVSNQSQGQPWAHVPCFYSNGLSSRWRTENEDCQIQTKHGWRHLADPVSLKQQHLTKWRASLTSVCKCGVLSWVDKL